MLSSAIPLGEPDVSLLSHSFVTAKLEVRASFIWIYNSSAFCLSLYVF